MLTKPLGGVTHRRNTGKHSNAKNLLQHYLAIMDISIETTAYIMAKTTTGSATMRGMAATDLRAAGLDRKEAPSTCLHTVLLPQINFKGLQLILKFHVKAV